MENKNKRSEIELLYLLKQEIKQGAHSGMCAAADSMRWKDLITYSESNILHHIIQHNTTLFYKYNYNGKLSINSEFFYYPKYQKLPRILWINKRIKERR